MKQTCQIFTFTSHPRILGVPKLACQVLVCAVERPQLSTMALDMCRIEIVEDMESIPCLFDKYNVITKVWTALSNAMRMQSNPHSNWLTQAGWRLGQHVKLLEFFRMSLGPTQSINSISKDRTHSEQAAQDVRKKTSASADIETEIRLNVFRKQDMPKSY